MLSLDEGFDLVSGKFSKLEEYLKQLNPKFSKGLFDCQKTVIKELEKAADEPGSVILVHLPTGGGKTLIGVAPLIVQAYRNDWDFAPHLVYTLPYRALVFHHSKVLLNDFIEPLNKIKQMDLKLDSFYGGFFIGHEGLTQGRAYFHPRWRAADAIVSTLDIFLLAYAKQVRVGYHSEYAAGVLSSSYLVFDEAHSYQGEHSVIGLTYTILQRVLKWASLAGLTSIVMTATLPHTVKHYLFKYVEERGKLRELKDLRPPLRRSINYSPLFKDNQTIYHLIKSDDFLKKVKEHQKTLLVLNTVGKAIDVFLKLKPIIRKLGIEPMLIHSRMTASARAERESELAKMREDTGYNKLVVSTQVAESGLDVSFDLLITELAPPEALVQRSGRCARRGGNGELLIVQPAGEYYYQPYQKELIDCTKDALKKFDIDFSSSFDLQLFIDDVYEKVPAELLTTSDSSVIDEVLSYFSVWTNPLLWPPPQYLQVREGVPVTLCHLPDEELSVLLNGKEAEHTGEVVKKIIQRCFTLDFDILKRRREIVEHDIDGSKILAGFTIYSQKELEEGRPIKLVAKVERIKSLNSMLTKNYGLLINPRYYKIEDSYELGLLLTRSAENKQ